MKASTELKIQQGARFGQIIDALDLTQTAVFQKTGIVQSTVSAMISGKREINKHAINAIKKNLPFVNINWLLTGEGEMFLENQAPVPATVQEPEPVYSRDPFAALRQLLQDYGERIQQVEERLLILESKQQHDEQ